MATLRLISSIWSRLPHDIICCIMSHLDNTSLVNWSCGNRVFFHYASCVLWSELCITDSEMTSFWDHGHSNNIIHFLTHNAHRRDPRFVFNNLRSVDGIPLGPATRARSPKGAVHERQCGISPPNKTPYQRLRGALLSPTSILDTNPAERLTSLSQLPADLPGYHVRCLKIKNRCDTSPCVIRESLQTLLDCLPRVRTFSHDGQMWPSILKVIQHPWNLSILSLRVGAEYYGASGGQRNPWGLWHAIQLDFRILKTMRTLRSLSIGHLISDEGESLAQLVTLLELQALRVSTTGWLVLKDKTVELPRPGDEISALLPFLEGLHTASLASDQLRGLPVSLKSLVLHDKFRLRTPRLHQALMSLLVPCVNLMKVEINLLLNWPKTHKPHNEFDVHSSTTLLHIQSWDQLCSDDEIKIAHAYVRQNEDRSQVNFGWTSPVADSEHPPTTNIARVLDQNIEKALDQDNRNITSRDHYWRCMAIRKTSGLCSEDFPNGVVAVYHGPVEGEDTGNASINQQIATRFWAMKAM